MLKPTTPLIFDSRVAHAGFPSPAADCDLDGIDLNEVLAPNPHSTFIMRAEGWSMKNAGINDGDLLIIDKSIEAFDGMVVVAWIEQTGGFVVKRLRVEKDGQAWLDSAADGFESIKIPEQGAEIFGVDSRPEQDPYHLDNQLSITTHNFLDLTR